MHDTDTEIKKAILVIPYENSISTTEEELLKDELESLSNTMGVEVVHTLFYRIRTQNTATYLGQGQTAQLKEAVRMFDADLVIFNSGVSPRVQRNLEAILETCVIDREEVILQIFADRAQTREAVLQVKLARSQYSLPRLTRKWTNLSQQRGGVKGAKGEGETQLELDRRKVLSEINALKKEIENVKKTRDLQRNKREKENIYKFALVGYTNSGKSSLLHALTNADILIEDKLFATLDTTTRTITLPNKHKALITDTVGFVSNLPHHLVDSFKSTLEEVKYADTLIIVCDAANPNIREAYNTTIEVLDSLEAHGKNIIVVINKIDNIFDEVSVKSMTAEHSALQISVKENINLDKLLEIMERTIEEDEMDVKLSIPLSKTFMLSDIYNETNVRNVEYTEDSILIDSQIKKTYLSKYKEYIL